MNTTIKVAVIINNENGKLLLIKEKYNKIEDLKWNFVKGTFDNAEESVIQCVEREANEEVNRNIKNIKLFKIFQYGIQENFRMLFVFRAGLDCLDQSQLSNENQQLDENIADWKWFTIEELMNMSENLFIAPYVKKVINSYNEDLGEIIIEKI